MKKRDIENWEESFMSDTEARDKILEYLQEEFKKGNKKSDNISIYLGLKKQVTFKQINKTLEELKTCGVIKETEFE